MNDKILVTGDFEIPDNLSGNNVVHLRRPQDNQHIINHFNGVRHYIIGGPEYADEQLLSHAPDLKHIVVLGTGTNSFVDLSAAFSKGILVENTPHLNADAVAEYALGAIIFNEANSIFSRNDLLEGGWYQKPHRVLNDLSVGIIGLGNIGSRIARKIRSIAPYADLSYCARTPKGDMEKELGIVRTELGELLSGADIIVLSIPYSSGTHNILDKQALSKVKLGSKIFNFSNPRTIDAQSLRDELVSGNLSFAYFDGYYNEWIQNTGKISDEFGLLALGSDKFIATSHIAAQANSVIEKLLNTAFKKIVSWKEENLFISDAKPS